VKPALGIIAGAGNLPGELIEAAQAEGRSLFVIGVKGAGDPEIIARAPHGWVGIGSFGGLLKMLRDNNCEEVVFAGAVRRPSLKNLSLDWYGIRMMPKALSAARDGDGALLSLLVEEIEQQGFRVVGAEQVAHNLAAPSGTLGSVEPSTQDLEDIAKGVTVVEHLGLLDIGQAAIVNDGLVLGVEAVEGTDALIERCGQLSGNEAGVLVKIAKPDQERRVDLPTIGLQTVTNASAAGLKGIAFEAAGALIIDREQVVKAADDASLFLYGIEMSKIE